MRIPYCDILNIIKMGILLQTKMFATEKQI